ncbi:MAG: bacillithiol biosynthesis cysteine-adding enzyme BshC [Acidobacteriota bacterium]
MHLTDCQAKVDYLDYRRLSGQSSLFSDFLYNFEKVSRFYTDAHLSLDRLRQRARQVLEGGREYPRDQLAPILEAFNRQAGAGDKTFAQIEKLRSPETVAVVTGQQLGLFGGPSYCVYKAATVVKVAQVLEKEGIPAVPVFWMPSDDSDFEEVRSSSWLNSQCKQFQVEFPAHPASARMVGRTSLQGIESCLEELRRQGLPGQFSSSMLENLAECYSPERDFRLGFGSWLSALFRHQGLILFDALSPGYKQLVRPVFENALQRREDILASLKQRRQELIAAGHFAQVHVDEGETLMFWMDGDKRYKLRYEDGRYQVKGDSGRSFSLGDVQALLQDCPDCIGPNVLLRPIVQDHLFPTAVYVGGPAEISYFSQISAISGYWGIEPAVFPRTGLTVVDRKAQRLLKRYDLSLCGLLESSRLEVTRRIVDSGESARILEGFDRLESEVERRLEALQPLIRAEDPPLADMLQGSGQKIVHQIKKVHDRFVKNHENRNTHLSGHLDYLYSNLLPNSKPQERVLNFNQFLALEGEGFIGTLLESIDPFAHGHHVLWV